MGIFDQAQPDYDNFDTPYKINSIKILYKNIFYSFFVNYIDEVYTGVELKL